MHIILVILCMQPMNWIHFQEFSLLHNSDSYAVQAFDFHYIVSDEKVLVRQVMKVSVTIYDSFKYTY